MSAGNLSRCEITAFWIVKHIENKGSIPLILIKLLVTTYSQHIVTRLVTYTHSHSPSFNPEQRMSYGQGSVYQQSLYQQPMQQNGIVYQSQTPVHQPQIMEARDVVSGDQYRYALQNFVRPATQCIIIVVCWSSSWWIAYCPWESRAAASATRGTRRTGSSAPSTYRIVRRRRWIACTRTRGNHSRWLFY